MNLNAYVPSEKMPETTFCMASFIYIIKKILTELLYIYIFQFGIFVCVYKILGIK